MLQNSVFDTIKWYYEASVWNNISSFTADYHQQPLVVI